MKAGGGLLLYFHVYFRAFFIYAALVALPLLFVHQGSDSAPFWPASGYALALLLSHRVGRWPWLLGLIFAANLLVDWLEGYTLAASFGAALGNTVEPALGAWLIRLSLRDQPLPLSLRKVSVFLLAGVVIGPAAGALIGSLALGIGLTDQHGLAVLWSWWTKDALGVLTVGGMCLTYPSFREAFCGEHAVRPALHLMLAVAGALTLLFGMAWFGLPESIAGYLLFPPLVWLALRYPPGVVALAYLLVSLLLVLYQTVFAGVGFDADVHAGQGLLILLGVTVYLMAGAMAELKRERTALRRTAEEQAAYFATSKEGILRLDMDEWVPLDLPLNEQIRQLAASARIASANHAAVDLLDCPGASLVGQRFFDCLAGDSRDVVLRFLAYARYQVDEIEYRIERRGSVHWILMSATGVVEAGKLRQLWVTLRDTTDRHRYLDQMEYQANHDELTGLLNRKALMYALDLAIDRGRYDKRTVGLLLFDINRFKEINDTLGHEVGDHLLQQVATRLRPLIEGSDMTLARMGGDEFALVAPGLRDPESAFLLGDEALALIQRPFELDALPVETGAAVGLAFFPQHGDEASILLRRAEVAMYAAKDDPANMVMYVEEADPFSADRLRLMMDARAAIRESQFELFYQPKLEIDSGAIVGVEALARWHHPQQGFISPAAFIPLVEVSELIRPFTRWVVQTAVAQLAAWREQGVRVDMSVNISSRNLEDPAFYALVEALVEQYGISPEQLELEITESALMLDMANAVAELKRLRALGVKVAIDDYGTGYSSLTYLKNLPVNVLKIDRSFVQTLEHSRDARAIVHSTVNLAHNLGLQVVAEGVEDATMWRLLAGMGCDLAQGFYMYKPMPPAEFLSVYQSTAGVWQSSEL